MKTITPDQAELIEAVLAEFDVGLLTASILEKDVHVTDALRLVSSGGTSLSKAYGLIERMSEDIDLKVVLDEPKIGGAAAIRNHLRKLKTEVTQCLEPVSFVEERDARTARNDNHFFLAVGFTHPVMRMTPA